jgi:hypothetical protein
MMLSGKRRAVVVNALVESMRGIGITPVCFIAFNKREGELKASEATVSYSKALNNPYGFPDLWH